MVFSVIEVRRSFRRPCLTLIATLIVSGASFLVVTRYHVSVYLIHLFTPRYVVDRPFMTIKIILVSSRTVCFRSESDFIPLLILVPFGFIVHPVFVLA